MRTKSAAVVSVITAAAVGTWWLNLSTQTENDHELWQGNQEHFGDNINNNNNNNNDKTISTNKDVNSPDLELSSSISTSTSTTSSLISITTPVHVKSALERPDGELGVEQIEADFPGDYVNPNKWFRQPGTPKAQDAEDLLTDEEKALLPEFSKSAFSTNARVQKIESFYGMGQNWSWPHHIESLDDEGLAPLTKWIQKYIYDHQNPISCKGKQFYVLPNNWNRHGLGALIKRISQELAMAINADRILVFDDNNSPGNTLVDPRCNGPEKTASLECVIQSMSKCASASHSWNSVRELTPDMFRKGRKQETPPIVLMALIRSMNERGIHPTGAFVRYWWRSQLSSFILRPNPQTLARMLEMRKDQDVQTGITLSKNRDRNAAPTVKHITVPFPLPPSTLSIHIRHGDKGGEGKLTSTRDYIVAAERFLHRNPLLYRKAAFVSTEDPSVIEVLPKTTGINPSQSYANSDWMWYYSKIPRVNSGPQANLNAQKNKTDALITHLMQLWMAVECDGFVGNRNSNWNKLIDAVRCTLMDKCRQPYLEAGFVGDWEHFP